MSQPRIIRDWRARKVHGWILILTCTLSLASLAGANGGAAGPFLVKEINPGDAAADT